MGAYVITHAFGRHLGRMTLCGACMLRQQRHCRVEKKVLDEMK
jgi:hypothetical protein